jgi:urease accessory protein
MAGTSPAMTESAVVEPGLVGSGGGWVTALPLFLWLSPAFPVGAYAYSHGLEWAAEAGDVRDAATLTLWLDDLCDHGAPRMDVALFAQAHRAAPAGLPALNELAVALAGSMERRLETTAQGTAFVAAARAAWPCAALDAFAAEPVAYPVAVGAVARGHGVALEQAAPAFALALFANLVSAATRLSVVGQTQGQQILSELTPRLAAMAARALQEDFETMGVCAFRSDIAAMKHETQYSRLFRS